MFRVVDCCLVLASKLIWKFPPVHCNTLKTAASPVRDPYAACGTWPSVKYISHFSPSLVSVSRQLLRPISSDCTRSITFICARLPRTIPSDDEELDIFSSAILSMTRLILCVASRRKNGFSTKSSATWSCTASFSEISDFVARRMTEIPAVFFLPRSFSMS